MYWSGRLILVSALLLTVACAGQQSIGQYAPELEGQRTHAQQAVTGGPVVLTRAQMANDVLFRAMAQIGTPYRWGGSSPQTGFDCSGLIGYVFNHSMNIQLPRTTREMANFKAPSIERTQLRSGDVVFFATNGGRRVSHAGIYVGDNRFVHAPSTGGKVRIDSLDAPYWNRAYLQAKRYLPEQLIASSTP